MRAEVLDFIIAQTKQNIEFLASQGALSPDEKLQIIQKLDAAQSSQILRAQPVGLGDSTKESPPNQEDHSIARSQTITENTYSPPPGPPPSNGFLYRARAMWAYNEDNREASDLSFKPGDTIEVITETNADWWLGRLSGRQGLFPSAYVERMRAPSPPSRMPPPHASAYQPSYGPPVHPFPAPTAPSFAPGPYPGGPPYQPPPSASAFGYPGPVNNGYAAAPRASSYNSASCPTTARECRDPTAPRTAKAAQTRREPGVNGMCIFFPSGRRTYLIRISLPILRLEVSVSEQEAPLEVVSSMRYFEEFRT